ncbi:MAG: hypothetical protein AMJ92_04720 [candidate division Zixibacteria bacterium SM23_81]|nr:MAG: hypothetical protein AMJ92_04720 [candidate division Zixibacteria bacterium SM23_81]
MDSFIMRFLTQLKSREKAQDGMAVMTILVFLAMFIISGLAFFSLGSYEAGLFERRSEVAQAFCNAESGTGRARWVLVETRSKSKAQVDNADMQVEAAEIDASGQAVREDQDLIDFYHDVRVSSRGFEREQESKVLAVFTPGLEYALGAAHNVRFHGGPNDGSWSDHSCQVNDVYIDGGVRYGNKLIGEDDYKYDQANRSDISLPDYFNDLSSFRNHFQSMADTVYWTNKSFGVSSNGDDTPIIFVEGDVEINKNVDKYWEKSLDVAIIATGNITVTSGTTDEDDRLVLVAFKDVTMVGNGLADVLNAVILAGRQFKTSCMGSPGGTGVINGFVLAWDMDLKGHDPQDGGPVTFGWHVNASYEIVSLHGGWQALQSLIGEVPLDLHQKNWKEVTPEGQV